jgi:hypothetical protein
MAGDTAGRYANEMSITITILSQDFKPTTKNDQCQQNNAGPNHHTALGDDRPEGSAALDDAFWKMISV